MTPIVLLILTAIVGVVIFVIVRRRSKSSRNARLEDASTPEPATIAASPSVRAPLLQRGYFVSHASVDAAVAQRITAALEAAGVSCWIAPRDIAPGAIYGDMIAEAVAHETRALVLILSQAAEASAAVKAELELARRFGKAMITVVLPGYEPQGKGILYYIGASQWVPLEQGDAAVVNALAAALPA